MTRCRNLTIFEGCDGGGKSTAAKIFAEMTDAHYVHFPAMPRVAQGLSRMYVEAMMPALMGYQDVVFDRCWLSEAPYGTVFREGGDRVGVAGNMMLERLAMRCGGVVVMCDPGWEATRASYIKRRHLEMLDSTAQLEAVYNTYVEQVRTNLPRIDFNYQLDNIQQIALGISSARFEKHFTHSHTAGNWDGRVAIVGESFGERKDHDPFYQWPFASFTNVGCSQWLTRQLDHVGISESELFWINADMLKDFTTLGNEKVVALGNVASEKLTACGIVHDRVPHPQYWKRFEPSKRYPLLNIILGE